eukprot:Clim_evm13s196 gene=Clim_evmTU13s196
MPPKVQKSKEAKAKAAAAGGKAKKKKWNKGKVRDKLENAVMFDKATYAKFEKEVPSYKLITPAIVSERMKVRGSLARAALKELEEKGVIKPVVKSHAQLIYTRAVGGDEEAEA